MYSIKVEELSKCYRLGKSGNPRISPTALLQAFRRNSVPTKRKPPKEIWALRDVSFDVEPGTVLGVIGPNGAGKTTLLKTIARVTAPTAGRVLGRGRVMSLLEVGAGFQPDLSGRENIFFHAALYGIPRQEVTKRFDEMVHWAELEEFIDTPVKRYSSGMYLRLAFSVAVNMAPDILLADEVLAVGDLAFQERCLQRVEQAGKEGLTVLFVSHDMAAIRRLCHRVIWLHRGQLEANGNPYAVTQQYEQAAWLAMGSETWNSTGAHVNEFGEILSTKLLSADGEEIGAARVSEDVILKMTFRLFSGRLNIRCVFDLHTEGTHVFRSMPRDVSSITDPGVYTATARIPAHLLAETAYTVDARVNVHDELGKPLPSLAQVGAIPFRAYDTDDTILVRGPYVKALPGVITPRLDWQLVRETDLVVR